MKPMATYIDTPPQSAKVLTDAELSARFRPMATRRRFMWARIALRRFLRERNDRRLKLEMGWYSPWQRGVKL
jgi:hypothetical protein